MKSNHKNIVIIIGALLGGLLLGWLFFGGNEAVNHDHSSAEVAQETVWTCSMHPQIRASEPGKCPICGMDLIPLEGAGSSGNSAAIEMSEYAMKLANIQTQIVGSSTNGSDLRLNGKIAIDERIAYSQATHVPGRIERLLVNFTGEQVKRGQALAVIYSPELITAQEELLQANAIKASQPELFEAAKQKLRNWRIGENQINRILESGKATDRFTITADVSGVVTQKLVEPGDYAERGTSLFQIADLSKMWVLFDLYERTMSMVQKGDSVAFTVASIPGETFTGVINFIDPLLNSQTRVATARAEIKSNDQLKPGMFVSGTIKGKAAETSENIVVPKSAVLWTGKRSVVYVKNKSGSGSSFMLREVVLGPAMGDSYEISEGLKAGEEVVVNGTFTVDAAAQLAGKPSMMNPQTEELVSGDKDVRQYLQNTQTDFRGEVTEEFQENLMQLLTVYLELKNALVAGQEAESLKLIQKFEEHLENSETSDLKDEAAAFWEEKRIFLAQHAQEGLQAKNLKEQRENFLYLSEAMIKTIAAFGLKNQTIYVDYCPMANSDQGAYWLSASEEIKNPYYGDAMLGCGEIVEQIK